MSSHPLRRPLHLLLALTLVLSQLMLLAPSTAFGAPTVTVNSTADSSDFNVGDRLCETGITLSNGSAECTLRAALEEANATNQVQEIFFDIPAIDPNFNGGRPSIRPTDVLPAITRRVTIDATTQPGFSSTPVVVLDGSSAGSGDRDGLLIQANNSLVRGLAVSNFADDGIEIHANNVTLVGNHITGNDDGVLVEDGTRPTVGGSTASDRNVIAGNRKHGVSLDTAHNATVSGNYIGVDASGAPAGNGGDGIEVWDGTRSVLIAGNVVSSNDGNGVSIREDSRAVTVSDNRIGSSPGGTTASGNGGNGVDVTDTSRNITLGPGNVVSGNGGNGISTGDDVLRVTIRGNFIGSDDSGSSPIPNGGHGILYGSATTRDDIGGTGAGDGNVIAYNGGDGVAVRDQNDLEVAIAGNSIFGNNGLGIDLPQNPSYNPNDPGDGDGGANDGLNFPTILSAEETAGIVYVDVELDVPNGYYLVEFFSNPSGADGTGYGEGEHLVTSYVMRVNSNTNTFSHTFPGSDGQVLTATATRCNADCTNVHFTSEFSPAHVITIGNHAPVLDPIPAIQADEQTPISFTANAIDDDGDDLEFDLVGGPLNAAINPAGDFTWTPAEDQGPGTYNFEIRVTDDGTPVHLDATTPVSITVGEVNLAPVLTDPGDFTVPEGSLLTFTAVASDPDEPANVLAFGLGGTAPTDASIDPDTGVFDWTPSELQGPGTFTFDVVVDDGTTSESVSVNVDVTEVNEAPAIVSPGDQASAEGATISLPMEANDPDLPANNLTYTATGLPPGLVINSGSGAITGKIQYHSAAGSPHHVSVTVTDGPGASDTANFLWVTDNTNRPPSLGTIPAFDLDEHQTLSFDVNATDPDAGTQLRFRLLGAPSGAMIDPINGILTWTPGEAHGPAVHTFDVVVSDSGSPVSLSASRQIQVTVHEVNRPPTLTNPGYHTVAEGNTLTVPIVATDPDQPANHLTYRLGAGAPTGVSLDPRTGVLTWVPTEAQGPTTHIFDVKVDDTLVTRSKPITVEVTEVNSAPTLANPGDQDGAEGDIVALAVDASDNDVPANTLRFSANGLPPGLTIDPVSGDIAGTIGFSAAASSPFSVSITVDDNAGATATTHFTWVTSNTNRHPVLDPISLLTVDEHTTLRFTAPGHDPDPGSKLTYALIGAPPGASINRSTGLLTWTPTEAQGPARYTFEIDVTDDDPQPLTTTETVLVSVTEANTPPVAGDDRGSTAEDTPVSISVLSNDSDVDYPANTLIVSSVEQPPFGGFARIAGPNVEFRPSIDFHGQVEFDYILSDGLATTNATITIDVAPVNDAPIAGDDHYRLVAYLPATLDVAINDSDPDGERLGVSLVTLPDTGRARVDNNRVIYDPVNGWTGSVEFDYMVRDASGASAIATIHVVVGDEVLVGARTLADDLGVEVVPFDPPTPQFDAETLSLIDLGGITLLADSFFQTVGALRVPLGFLGVTVAMVVGFGATSEVPALVFGSRRRHWAIVRLGRHQRLPAYFEPGGRKVVYNFDPTAAGIVSNGRSRQIGGQSWVPIDTLNGPGWIYRTYLTEQVDLQAFADDPRPVELVHELANRLREGKSIASLVSNGGLVVALTGSPNQIAPEQLAGLMGGKRLRHVPGFDKTPNTPHEFSVAVAQPFLEAYDATAEITAETPHSRSALIPTECWNFPYLALGTKSHRQPWLVFFEYRDGKASIAGLGVDE